ncbi:MAG: 4Fe-4S dicluster domain-containing protein [Deltaproteobacteria bacterium]|nr:4Fe-4S dicluster domain-containing protein [Deltaproteobacteria bacterium]
MENTLRKKAKELLEKGDVKVVIGYGWNKRKTRTTPIFITKPEDTDKLVFNPLCVNNLSLYLTRKFADIKAIGKPAIVAKGCDIKTIAVLISESQIKREDVVILGMTCNGVVYKQELWKGELKPEIMPTKCNNCDVRNPHIADFVVGEKTDFKAPDEPTGMVFDKIRELDKKSNTERWDFWLEHFNRCIKCYACRQICPLCYCERCIAEKNMPQWIETSAHPRGNLAWNLKRAMDLSGRCTFCGECERACPVNIPLNLVNQKLALVVKDAFGHKSGYDEKVHPPLIVFNLEDTEDFIK